MDKICLGVDVSAKKIDVCLRLGQQVLSSRGHIFNTEEGFGSLLEWLDKHLNKHGLSRSDVHVVMEATGTYHENVAQFFLRHQCACHVMPGHRAKKYLQSLGKSKNDKLDAKGLSLLGIERTLPDWKPLSSGVAELRQLTRQRETFMSQSTAIKNQIHALESGHYVNEFVLQGYQEMLESLKKAVAALDKNIHAVLKQHPELEQNVKYAESISGVGILTAVVLVAETNNFAYVESRNQLVCYAGYDITEHQSGSTVRGKKHMSKAGNAHIRRILFMAASSAMQHNAACHDLYQRVLARNGGIKMKAHVAVQRKLLVLAYALVKSKSMYNLETHLKGVKKNQNEDMATSTSISQVVAGTTVASAQ